MPLRRNLCFFLSYIKIDDLIIGNTCLLELFDLCCRGVPDLIVDWLRQIGALYLVLQTLAILSYRLGRTMIAGRLSISSQSIVN